MKTEFEFGNLFCLSSLIQVVGWYITYRVIRYAVPKPTVFEEPDKPQAKQRQIEDYYNCCTSLIHAIVILALASYSLIFSEDRTWGIEATRIQFIACQLSFNYFVMDTYLGIFELKTMDAMMAVHHVIMLSACAHIIVL